MVRKILMNYGGITAGSGITALGLVLFLIPGKIAAGGVSGLATVIYHLFHLPAGLTMLALNIPLFIAGLQQLGLVFSFKTIYGTVSLSIFVDLLARFLVPPTQDPLLAAIYGGLLTGLGLGIVFRSGGTTGGTDLAARIIHRYLKLSVGQALMAVDAVVIMLAGLVFNLELALYALLALFLTTKVLDFVQEGFGHAKAALIISEKNQEIGRAILSEMNRGATALEGRGLYTGTAKELLLCVVSRAEITKLKGLVVEVDPEAFVVLSDVREVLGEGFQEIRPH